MLVFEIGLRIAGISYPSFYTIDEHIGMVLRPGAEGWFRAEGEAYLRINSEGLRDREHTKVKPASTFRIAVLGDSMAEGFQVPMENTFWAIMEQELEKCEALAGQKIEAINFGVSGYGTAQELATLRHRAWDYDPDMVVLAFLTGNDIRNNSRALQKPDEEEYLRPYFIYHDGELVIDASFNESPLYKVRRTWFAQLGYLVIDHSRVLQIVNEAKNVSLEKFYAAQVGNDDSNDALTEVGLDNMIYLEPKDPDWTEAWRVTEGLITLMNGEVTEKGADFLVVTLSNGIQVHPEPSVREAFMESLDTRDLFYADLRIKALGEREGFAVLNLAQPFQSDAEERQVFLHGFENATLGKGHWNAEGHRLAGQMVAQQICEQSLNDR